MKTYKTCYTCNEYIHKNALFKLISSKFNISFNIDIAERKLNPALEFWHKLLTEIKDKLGVNHPTAMKVGKEINTKVKEQNPDVTIVGLQPSDGSKIAGIRRWPIEYRPEIFDPSRVDVTLDIDQHEAEDMARQLAVKEGIFCGVSAGGAVSGALRIARELTSGVVVCIICDRGDRYLSTDLFPR